MRVDTKTIIALLAFSLLLGCGTKSKDSDLKMPGPAKEYVKDGKPDLDGLTEVLRSYMLDPGNGGLPKELNELVTKKYIKALPTAPAGFKLAIDTQKNAVILAPE